MGMTLSSLQPEKLRLLHLCSFLETAFQYPKGLAYSGSQTQGPSGC